MDNELQPLENKSSRTEKYVKLGAAFISSLNPIGTVISTVINESISSAQQSRMVDFVNELLKLYQQQNKEIEEIKKEFETMVTTAEKTLFFELAMKASAESNSNILHHCYAYYIFNTVKAKKLEDVQHERLFRLISSLSEYEIIMLIGYRNPRFIGRDSEFDDEYEEIVFPRTRTMGSPESDVIFNAFFDQYVISLEQKGLISRKTEIKEKNLKFTLQYTPWHITTIGELVVDAVYDENFMLNIKHKETTLNENNN